MPERTHQGPPEFDQMAPLIEFVWHSLPDPGTSIIGIDGNDGVGKTTLVRQLSKALGTHIFSLDCYIAKNKGDYVQYLDTERLRRDVVSLGGNAIVEGVCLRNALATAGLSANFHVYVKRIDSYGFWHDQDELASDEPVDDQIARLKSEARIFAECFNRIQRSDTPLDETESITPLREEIIRYHRAVCPQAVADCVFLRVESEAVDRDHDAKR